VSLECAEAAARRLGEEHAQETDDRVIFKKQVHEAQAAEKDSASALKDADTTIEPSKQPSRKKNKDY